MFTKFARQAALVVGSALLVACPLVQAQETAAGLWKTFDEETKAEKSLIRITDNGGTLTGKVEKVLTPGRADAKCDACTDARKGQPIEGLTMLTGLKAADAGTWDGGEILDPQNGKTYKAKAKLIEGGKKLEVRGFIGVALIGRTQTWTRVE